MAAGRQHRYSRAMTSISTSSTDSVLGLRDVQRTYGAGDTEVHALIDVSRVVRRGAPDCPHHPRHVDATDQGRDGRRSTHAPGDRASSWHLWWITATTGGILAFLGAILGSSGAYVACAAVFSNSSQNETGNLIDDLTQVLTINLLAIFEDLPQATIVGGWLTAGREPREVSRAPESSVSLRWG